ncbi:MAG: glycosyltransferase family 2 protein [Thermodesulfovibrionales bacterium]|nr:glycosyltransferase family 2 protein [Thermodesulfovibrionales bacterium]
MNRNKLSVAIITKNEEDRIEDCLKSLSFADEIVILDSESTDRTVEIARRYKCNVYVEKWEGFGSHKNKAIAKCQNKWILILDADERIPKETADKILKILLSPDADAYSFPRKNYFKDKWIRYSGWWPDRVVRLFNKDKSIMKDLLVHESVITTGKIIDLDTPIIHKSVRDIEHIINKVNLYSSLGANDLFNKGKKVSLMTVFLKTIAAFLKLYVIKRGFLDGYEGFVISYSHSVYTCYKYLKLWELSNLSKIDLSREE